MSKERALGRVLEVRDTVALNLDSIRLIAFTRVL